MSPPRRNRWRTWHRRAGLTAALLMASVAVTGLLLNHEADLELARQPVESRLLQNWYGIDAPLPTHTWQTGDRWLSWLDGRLYLDRRPITGEYPLPPDGAVPLAGMGMVLVAFPDALLFLSAEGEVVDRLGRLEGVPTPIDRLGRDHRGRAVLESRGLRLAADEMLERWHPIAGDTPVVWSRTRPLPPSLAEAVQSDYRASHLTLHRLVLDIHTGRILGGGGVLLMDLGALLLLLLAASGVWGWSRTRRRRMASRTTTVPLPEEG